MTDEALRVEPVPAVPQEAEPPPPTTVKPPEDKAEPLPVPEGTPDEIRTLVRELADEGVTIDFRNRVVEVKGVILLDRMNPG